MNDLARMISTGENGNEETEAPLHMGLHEHDLIEGGEFLSDGVRMNEQVFKTKDAYVRKTRYHL